MATSEAPAASAPPSEPPLRDQSPSNLSSPLSDVEDKDSDPYEMVIDVRTHDSPRATGTPEPPQEGLPSSANTDSDSKLSEIDVNDSEAETERLYDTPPKNKPSREIINGASGDFLVAGGGKSITSAAVDYSPSKLQHQVRPDPPSTLPTVAVGNNGSDDDDDNDDDDDDEPLSDADDDLSLASSSRALASKRRSPYSPSPAQKSAQADTKMEEEAGRQVSAERAAKESSVDSGRKRKRASAVAAEEEQAEQEQPFRKRTGSVGALEHEASGGATVVAVVPGDENASLVTARSGDRSVEEDIAVEGEPSKSEAVESIEASATGVSKPGKSRRSSTRKRKSPDEGGAATDEQPNESAKEDGEIIIANGDAAQGTEEEQHEADEEAAEIAHKNEEERT